MPVALRRAGARAPFLDGKSAQSVRWVALRARLSRALGPCELTPTESRKLPPYDNMARIQSTGNFQSIPRRRSEPFGLNLIA
jgi:hypothetical protein